MAKCKICGKHCWFKSRMIDNTCRECIDFFRAHDHDDQITAAYQNTAGTNQSYNNVNDQLEHMTESYDHDTKETYITNYSIDFCHSFFQKIFDLIEGKYLSGEIYPSPRNMIPYLRSPYNSGIREMSLFAGFDDLRFFDDNEYRHIALLALLAGGGVSGPFASLFSSSDDLAECEAHLWEMGFFVVNDQNTTLYNSTAKDLKAFLDEHEIHCSAKRKYDLVTCIIENLPDDEIAAFCKKRNGHEPSDLGYWMIRSLYNDEHISIPMDVLPENYSPRHKTNGRVYVPTIIK